MSGSNEIPKMSKNLMNDNKWDVLSVNAQNRVIGVYGENLDYNAAKKLFDNVSRDAKNQVAKSR
jgi:hypothetical protein